jgi:hypothetical protein
VSDVDVVLSRVLDDLAPEAAARTGGATAEVTVDGQPLQVRVGTRGRTLLRVTETTFVVRGRRFGGDLHLVVRQRGAIRPQGITVVVRQGGEPARRLADEFTRYDGLERALRALDYTSFDVVSCDGCLEARITLMGAAMTRMRVPPTAAYTRLHEDQRAALLATVQELSPLRSAA